ncbi:hypothetical protein, partial [Bifidobacterium choerinum]|uniref:hypothetical protein n=1 Tax=Bifidobacterium choerinum TaxID=35760 RepID=UPI003F8F5AEF
RTTKQNDYSSSARRLSRFLQYMRDAVWCVLRAACCVLRAACCVVRGAWGVLRAWGARVIDGEGKGMSIRTGVCSWGRY